MAKLTVDTMPPCQREDYEERAALIYDGCRSEGVTIEEAERRAWDMVQGHRCEECQK